MRNVQTIYLAGVPASGKTTIFRKVRERLFADAVSFKNGLCVGIEKGPMKMIGVFDGTTFEGTDRLSMSVIDDVLNYIRGLEAQGERCVIFIEGDRLLNERFLKSSGAAVLVIDASEKELTLRHALRGDSQSETFLKGRRTKIENIVRKFGLKRVYNNTPEQSTAIADFVCEKALKWVTK